jgi:large subunit ribosomal protein L44e
MKFPEAIKTYCPTCKKHTDHEVRLQRKGKERSMSRGRRKFEEVKRGYGSIPRTPKKQVYKVGKRPVFVLKCKVCNKRHLRAHKARTKKTVEIKS